MPSLRSLFFVGLAEKILKAILFYSLLATFNAHFIIIHLLTLIILDELYIL
jgi:hypothetical protein